MLDESWSRAVDVKRDTSDPVIYFKFSDVVLRLEKLKVQRV